MSFYTASNQVAGLWTSISPLELAGFKELLASVEPPPRGDEATFLFVIHQGAETLYGALPAAERGRLVSVSHP